MQLTTSHKLVLIQQLRLLFLFLILSLLFTSVSSATGRAQVGWISDINASSAKSYILRGGIKEKIRLLMPVFVNDEVYIEGSGAIDIQIGNRVERVDKSVSPYRLVKSEEVTLKSSVFEWVASFFNDDQKNLLSTISAVSRSTKLTIPLMGDTTSFLTPHKTLHLSWINGHAPFTVAISTLEDNRQLVVATNIVNNKYNLDISSLDQGNYRLVISDKLASNEFYFKLVDVIERPSTPVPGTCSDQHQCELYFALETIYNADEAWLLESYQLLNQLSDRFSVAKKLVDKLSK